MDPQLENGPFMTNRKFSDSTDRISVVSRIYIWSLIFEPFLYFIYASGGQTIGIPFSVSRILQIIVLMSFFIHFILIRSSMAKQQLLPIHLNKYFVYYLLILCTSSFLGLFIFHSYEVIVKINIFNEVAVNPFLKSKYMRPFFDLFLVSYYYFYFIVLARHFISSAKAISYYFKYFILSFYWIIFFGFVDLGHGFLMGSALIKRHFGEATDVGTRFHSFLGEPRDAFVYLVYAGLILVIYHVRYSKIRRISIMLYLILAALILTQSTSGITGIFIGGGLVLIYFFSKRKTKAFYFSGVITFIIFLISTLVQYSPRMVMYMEAFSSLFDDLKSGKELPYVLMVQSVNFLPLWGMYLQFTNFDYIQLLFGSGFSSSSYFNMNSIGASDGGNPHAQITRLLYEGGIFGTLAYLLFLMKPVIKFLVSLPSRKSDNIVFIFFLLSGASLAHRSLIPFILTGLILAYNSIYRSAIIK